MAKLGWAVRRLSDGPGPASGLAPFPGRQETAIKGEVHLGYRLEGWKGFFDLAADLHPITRAALGFYIWPMAGIGPEGERLEAAVLAARVAHRIVGLGWSLFLRQQAAVAGCGLAVTL